MNTLTENITQEEFEKKMESLSAYSNIENLLKYSSWDLTSSIISYLREHIATRKHPYKINKYITMQNTSSTGIGVFLRRTYCNFNDYIYSHKFIEFSVNNEGITITTYELPERGVIITNPSTLLAFDMDKLHDKYDECNLMEIDRNDLVDNVISIFIEQLDAIMDEATESLVHSITNK